MLIFGRGRVTDICWPTNVNELKNKEAVKCGSNKPANV